MISPSAFNDLFRHLLPAVAQAGGAILAIRGGDLGVDTKSDNSPVTLADQRAEATLLPAIEEAMPDTLIVAEERVASEGLPADGAERFWLVDPLDGTKEFIKGGTDFTVNLGLIDQGRPVFGIVLAPADGRLYWGGQDWGAWRGDLRGTEVQNTRRIDAHAITDPLAIVASASHSNQATQDYLAQFPGAKTISVGSSLKFCLVAEGQAGLYPRLGPTMEWDTAAADAVLRAAGGRVLDPSGGDFRYNKPEFRNGHFLACAANIRSAPPVPN